MDLKKALKQQQNEINDFAVYSEVAKISDTKNREILLKIANDEKSHYDFWKQITKKDLKPKRWLVLFYLFLAKFFGISFSLKLLEKKEEKAQDFYKSLINLYPEAKKIYEDEILHEKELLGMLKDLKLLYAGAVVLGMNDALVELTGTLTGIALAFDNSKYVGIVGVIMGIAASFSMAASAYLEARENLKEEMNPKKYSLYTGVSYILTAVIVVFPFFIFSKAKIALIFMFFFAALSITVYNFYISVAKDEDFYQRVKEMLFITFGVSLVSFFIGYIVNRYFGIEI